MTHSSHHVALAEAMRRYRPARRAEALLVVEEMKKHIILHPHFKAAYNSLYNAVTLAEPGDILVVPGATGTGKTSLLGALSYDLEKESKKHPGLEGRVPCVFVQAPKAGKYFAFRDLWRPILVNLGDPLLNDKRVPKNATREMIDRALLQDQKGRLSDNKFRYSVVNAVQTYGVVWIFIDEGNHMLSGLSPEVAYERLDELKTFANETGAIIVVLGTYELVPLMNVNAQMIRRCEDLHVRRYHKNKPGEMKDFVGVLENYQKLLSPLPAANLVEHQIELIDRSVGLVGELKKLLLRWVRNYATQEADSLSIENLRLVSKKPVQLRIMESQIVEGELSFEGLLDPSATEGDAVQDGKASTTGQSRKARAGRPGMRNPSRDPVGK